MTESLQVFGDSRDAILLGEVAMWLHMIGKFHEDFVNQQVRNADITIPSDLRGECPRLAAILSDHWWGDIWTTLPIGELKAQGLSMETVITQHRMRRKELEGGAGFLKLVNDAHGRGSGVEKGILKGTSYSSGKSYGASLASVVGYEQNICVLNHVASRKKSLWMFLESELEYVRNQIAPGDSRFNLSKWREWRTSFICQLKSYFSKTIADTRRPINDVTLWDQTAASVAFFKTELAEILVRGWRDPYSEPKFRYRVFTVGTDGETFLAQSLRVADALGRKSLLFSAWDSVKDLLETEYPVALEVYRDVNGISFLFPDVDNILESTDTNGQTLHDLIHERLNEEVKGEISFLTRLSKSSSRSVFYLGTHLTRERASLTASGRMLSIAWQQVRDRCIACHARPCGYGGEEIEDYKSNLPYYRKKAQERQVCCVCMKRMEGRSRQWCTERRKGTIWMDEVADQSGRVALISGRFEIDKWLDGQLVSSTAALDFMRLLGDNPGLSFDAVTNELKDGTELDGLHLFPKVWECHAGTVRNLTNLNVTQDDLGDEDYAYMTPEKKLALAIWRKTPSFARLYRLWQMAQSFWAKDIVDRLEEDRLVSRGAYRLIIRGVVDTDKLGEYHVYEIGARPQGPTFPFVWDPKNRNFISAFDMDLGVSLIRGSSGTFGNDERPSWSIVKDYLIAHRNLRVMLERASDCRLAESTILNNPTIGTDSQSYTRAIPILTEPHEFMVLVPADRALPVLNHIRREYEVQFSKVKNRLPLHLNAVFFSRREPLYAVMDAARRMLRRTSSSNNMWKVEHIDQEEEGELVRQCDTRLGPHVKPLRLRRTCAVKNGSTRTETLTTLVSYSTADANVTDEWYPYFFVSKAASDRPVSRRTLRFQGPLPGMRETADLIHVSELYEGDEVYYMPSTFDFEFLDVTSRRFELFYDKNGRRVPRPQEPYSTKPYLLEELSDFEDVWESVNQYLTSSQARQIQETIENRRHAWQVEEWDDSVLRVFVRQVLLRVFRDKWWQIPEERRILLEDWAVSGRLSDVFELYMEIFKRKPSRSSQVTPAKIGNVSVRTTSNMGGR